MAQLDKNKYDQSAPEPLWQSFLGLISLGITVLGLCFIALIIAQA